MNLLCFGTKLYKNNLTADYKMYSSNVDGWFFVFDQESVSKEEYEDLQTRFTVAEKALADKQQKIDDMKMEIFEKEKELETISVFKAQVLWKNHKQLWDICDISWFCKLSSEFKTISITLFFWQWNVR